MGRYRTDGRWEDGIVVLSSTKNPCEKNTAVAIRQKTEAVINVRKASTQKRKLKTKLKICRRTVAAGKNQPQMFLGL